MLRALRLLVFVCLLGALAYAGVRWGLGTAQRAGLVGPVSVPEEYRSIVRDAAERCPQVPVEVLAAQIHAESGFNPSAVSPAGAQGIAADGDGRANVWDPLDAIHSAAALNCVNRRLVKKASGPRLANTLAAYNAGFSAVLKHDGIPPYEQTRDYVRKILENAKTIAY